MRTNVLLTFWTSIFVKYDTAVQLRLSQNKPEKSNTSSKGMLGNTNK